MQRVGLAVLLGLCTPGAFAQGIASGWAVIAAGSKTYSNYRHQADACHAYQLLIKSGMSPDRIILMMEDDVATSSRNPFPGKLFNKPSDHGVDVREGCVVDYKGSQVTAKLFLSVITGDESGVPHGGKVLKSTSEDRVFLNFADHGGVNIIAFPHGGALHSSDLARALKTMQQKNMFKELLFYMEACESGSMFPGLTSAGKIFAVTAANAHESSMGCYCGSQARVNGRSIGSCLGDTFSISWMEDADKGKFSTETIKTQVAAAKKRTTHSHVSTFGDTSFENEPFGGFVSDATVAGLQRVDEGQDGNEVDTRDIPLYTAWYNWDSASEGPVKAALWQDLQTIKAARRADETLFRLVAESACTGCNAANCTGVIMDERHEMKDAQCHKLLVDTVHEACPRRAPHNPGGWNGYNMKYSQMLVNMCEKSLMLSKDAAALKAIVQRECASASSADESVIV